MGKTESFRARGGLEPLALVLFAGATVWGLVHFSKMIDPKTYRITYVGITDLDKEMSARQIQFPGESCYLKITPAGTTNATFVGKGYRPSNSETKEWGVRVN